MAVGAVIEVDARGLRCPWPVLRLARAARSGPGRYRLLADDPAVPADLAAMAAERGWSVEAVAEDGAAVSTWIVTVATEPLPGTG